jgi:hypothetical protein
MVIVVALTHDMAYTFDCNFILKSYLSTLLVSSCKKYFPIAKHKLQLYVKFSTWFVIEH